MHYVAVNDIPLQAMFDLLAKETNRSNCTTCKIAEDISKRRWHGLLVKCGDFKRRMTLLQTSKEFRETEESSSRMDSGISPGWWRVKASHSKVE